MYSRCARGTQSRNQRYLDNLNLLFYALLMHELLDTMCAIIRITIAL